MAALDVDGEIVWANLAWLRLLGWAPADLRGRPFAHMLHPDDAAAVRALIAGGEAALRVRTRSGGERRMAFSTLVAPEDGLVYLCGRDASETRELEIELRAAEDRFRVVTEATSDAIADLRRPRPDHVRQRGRARRSSAGSRTSCSASRSRSSSPSAGAPSGARAWSSSWAPARTTCSASVLELDGVRRDGTEFPMEASLGVWERLGRRAFTGIMRDVSERRRTQRQLERSRARYRALVVNLPEVIVALLDPDLRLVVMEGGQLSRRGLRPDDFEGRLLAETVPPAIFERFEPYFRAALAGETQHFEFDSESVRYEVRVMPLTGDDGVAGAFAVARDVTALREAQRSLEERAARARALERRAGGVRVRGVARSLRAAAHDRLVPRAPAPAPRRQPERGGGRVRRARGRRRRPHAGADRGSARLFAHGHAPSARRSRSTWARSSRRSPDTVTGDPPPVIEWDDLPTVTGEPGQLVQLLQNLITNAVKFVAPGTVPHVRVSAERDGDVWRFAVDDNGIGIDPQYAERIFGMFQRLHTRDTFPGTGIGLAIARKVVEHHDGSISAEPRPEGGTRMTFTLPA